MSDTNNNKMLSQKVCRCGNAVADLLDRIDGFSENMRKVKFGESPTIIRAYEESVNYLYGVLQMLNPSVILDTKEEQQHSMSALNKVSEMATIN